MDVVDFAKVSYLILLILVSAVIFLVILRVLFSGRKSIQQSRQYHTRTCSGARNNQICGKKLFICENCHEEGCEMKDCSNRTFKNANCLKCESPNTREQIPPELIEKD